MPRPLLPTQAQAQAQAQALRTSVHYDASILYPVIKHEYAQIQIPAAATNTRFYFPELPNLRNVHLQCIEVPTVAVLPKSPDNYDIINDNLFRNTFLTLLNYEGKEFVHQIPLMFLNYQTNSNIGFETLQKQFVGQRVNWTKSYIEFSSNANISPAKLEVCAFSIYYADLRNEELKDAKSNFLNRS